MAYSPRVGTEFSSAANVRFLAAPIEHDRPAHVVRFENGSKSGRFSTSGPAYNFTIICHLNAADLAVLTDFAAVNGVVTPFTVDHPQLGEGTCYLKLTRHELVPVVGGNPVWYRVEVPVEGAF